MSIPATRIEQQPARPRRGVKRLMAAVRRFFDRIDDELELPEDRNEWDVEDYADERQAVHRGLVRVCAQQSKQKSLSQRLRAANDALRDENDALRARCRRLGIKVEEAQEDAAREGLMGAAVTTGAAVAAPTNVMRTPITDSLLIETTGGAQAGIIDLGNGLYIVNEMPAQVMRDHGPKRVTRVMERVVVETLLAEPGTPNPHWTRSL